MKTPSLREVLQDVQNYLKQLDAMQPNKNRGSEGRRIRALIAKTLRP